VDHIDPGNAVKIIYILNLCQIFEPNIHVAYIYSILEGDTI